MMKHVLIIGGTGMLREMSSWVIKQANKTMLIGRNKEKLEQTVPSGYEHKVHYQFIDYRDTLKLQEGIQHALEVHGAFDYVIAWIHSSAPKALPVIFNELNHLEEKWRLFHIKGSSTNVNAIKQKIEIPKNCLYRDVQLGFKIEENRSRWLTHHEISRGVIEAINLDREKTIVGVLEPWERRP